jgi:hypothetical protein
MSAVIEVENSSNSGGYGPGRGFVRLPALVGDFWYLTLIPFLCIIPIAALAWCVRPFYRVESGHESMVGNNFAFLSFGLIVAIINASCYRAD